MIFDLQNCIYCFKPVVIILQVGGNSIFYLSARPEKVACYISPETLGKFKCVQVGVVCDLFIRLRPRNNSPQLYEGRPKIINNMLPVLLGDINNLLTIRDINNRKIMFWRHLHMMNSPLHVLGSNGVHLSAVSHKKFYRSIILAIIHALYLIVWIAFIR